MKWKNVPVQTCVIYKSLEVFQTKQGSRITRTESKHWPVVMCKSWARQIPVDNMNITKKRNKYGLKPSWSSDGMQKFIWFDLLTREAYKGQTANLCIWLV